MIRTLIVDDHTIVRAGIKQILAMTPDIAVVAEAGDGSEALEYLRDQPIDMLLLDMTLPGVSGVELIRSIRHGYPALPILVLSVHNDSQTVTRALRAGASGYLAKDSEPQILISAVHRLAGGGRFIDPQLVEALIFDAPQSSPVVKEVLSARELQVLERLATGCTVNEIAAEFSLSAKTISTHKMRLMQKLGVDNNADLIRYAIDNNVCAN
ncbi:response regulator transcription factor [Burkholderia ambifaria]|uniref:response regulator transcription factor n=1 Tax=Burkholderia ambifaria TaxID=152480 RepID=UPI001B8E3C42|nr:response regulator transcription factor [Burkholderia ambifaria]MBR8334144.1 response regulator transcription factor [Burkholderia ambifaria]